MKISDFRFKIGSLAGLFCAICTLQFAIGNAPAAGPEALYRDPASAGILINTGVIKTRLHQLELSDGAAVDTTLAGKATAAQGAKADTAVQSLTVTPANGISGSFTSGTTPAVTLILGDILPTSVNINSTTASSVLRLHTSTSGTGTTDGFEISSGSGTNYIWDYENKPIQLGINNTLAMTLSGSGLAVVGPISASNFSGSSDGVNHGDQVITLTGDVSGSGTGSFAATIANNSVSLAKLADMATASFLGRNTAATGDPEVLSIATVKTMLNLVGTNSGDQTITLTGDVIGSGTGSFAATIANDSVTYAKMQNVSATSRFLGRKTAGAGDPEELTASDAKTILDLTGTNSGDQTITLTGDVTGSGTGSFAATIANNSVSLAKLADMATASFLGRNTAATGDPEVLSIATAKTMLNLTGTNSGDQTITLTGDVTGSGTGSFAATIANDSVTYAKMQNVSATSRFLGRKTAGAGDPEELTASDAKTILDLTGTNSGDQTITLTGDVTGSGTGSFAATLANDAVTYAKMQNVSATSRFLGRKTAGAGDPEELTASDAKTILALAESDVSSLVGDLALKAPLASPTFTGTPLAPTAAANTNTTQLATTAFVLVQSGNKQTQTADGTVGTYTFTIPSGYTSIRIMVNGRSSAAVDGTGLRVQFNSDTGSNYDTESVSWTSGTTSAAGASLANTSATVGWMPGASATASYSGSAVISIPGHANTAFYKTYVAQCSGRDGGLLYMDRTGGNWRNTAAITSVTVLLVSGNFVTGSTIEVVTE